MASVRLNGDTSGFIEISAPNVAGSTTITLPATSGGNFLVTDSNGDLNVDSGTLFVDASENRVGIGTTSPERLLHVFASDTSITSNSSSTLVLERDGVNVLNILKPNGTAGILSFSGNSTNGDGRITYDDSSSRAMEFWTASSEAARIDSSGRLLVGTSTSRGDHGGNTSGAETNLQVEGTSFGTSSAAFIRNSNTSDDAEILLAKSRGGAVGGTTIVQNNDDVGTIVFEGADGAKFLVAASIKAEIDGTPGTNDMPGRLVFSTTLDGASSPTERFRITQGGTFRFFSSDQAGIRIIDDAAASSTNSLIAGSNSGTGTQGEGNQVFAVRTNGNVQNSNNSYGALSDIKLKENIVDASSQWDDLKAIQVRNYNFKEETGQQTHTQLGVVAQEIELVSPGLVSEAPDKDDEGNDLGTTTKSVNYSVLYMKAVKALQEAMTRIEALENANASLEARLTALEGGN